MVTWRPACRTRFKALGLHWRGGDLLAAEILDDNGRVKGVRPLGGSVEFGETAQAAVVREFYEELGVTVDVVGEPIFMENIFTHEGSLGHEVLAIFDVTFADSAFADIGRIKFQEDDGTECFAEWFALDALDLPNRPRLYPDGLKARLLKSR